MSEYRTEGTSRRSYSGSRTRQTERRRKKRVSPFGKVMIVLGTTLGAILLTLVLTISIICNGPSRAAGDLFVSTVLESGNLKFLATMFVSEERIQEINSKTSMGKMEQEVDPGMIHTDPGETEKEGNFDANGIELVPVSGRTFSGKMLIIKDPAQVKLATTYEGGVWSTYGKELDVLVNNFKDAANGRKAVAGVNGGLYAADGNKGGSPYGVAVSQGVIQYNAPEGWAGLYMIGFDEKNILQIIDIEGMNRTQLKALIQEKKIRDAVAFQDETSDSNNHFVSLIINGTPRELNGQGSGANPRTAIGQRADGAVLLLTTDGRGAAGHLGATAADLIRIMQEFGAVNAANLDGGSSTSMYYNGNYEQTSVTLYYANRSWRLPTAFVVEEAAK